MGRIAVALAGLVGSSVILVSGTTSPAAAAGILPPSNPTVNVTPQVTPHCSLSPVDDTSSGCIDSILHNINYARSLEGLGPLVLPSDYASDPVPVQQLILTDEERGDRGLPEFSGLDPQLNASAQVGAQGNADPIPPAGYLPAGSIFAQDYTPLGADFAWMYDDGYGGTNRDCTSPSDSGCWGHRDNILGAWATNGSQTATMGDGNTGNGQYAEIFAEEADPAGPMIVTTYTSSLPTPTSPTPPDVVQVLPATSSSNVAGTPVTIEGNYFGTSPQVFFGGVPASNVQVDWNGQLTANAPADPAGTATDQVVVTVATASGGASTSTPMQGMNEFTYAPRPATHGYWLVGSDGGIFSFGAAQFHGSTGSLHLQRPIVGITPTGDRGGYWLVASDGGIFAFGDARFHGSIPGAGLHPAGSGQPNSLNAPIVGMVPSSDGGGYFMVASDGGVFAFGDAKFAGSCPGIGGCQGAAVAVMPDATGNGYWVVTSSGSVYPFGDAVKFGQPGPGGQPVTSAVATPNGQGYWILNAVGSVFAYGNAVYLGRPPAGSSGGLNPASAIFDTSDGSGYWVGTALGKVSAFGDAPNDGDMSSTHLNGSIVAASGS